jgi:ParB-like chromosome segregation protein Spo0J
MSNEARARKGWRDVLPIHPAADLFPLMEGTEFDELVEDIRKHGLRAPMVIWEDVATREHYLLDGRNRLRALLAAGRELDSQYFSVVGHCEATRDPYAFALSVNVHRRHLSAEQKRELIAKVLKATPEKSDRQIAKITKASPTTVGTVRAEMEAEGDVSKLDTRTDTKGRRQPAKKKRATVDNNEMPTEEEAEESYQETLYDQAFLVLDSMAGSTRRKFFAALRDKYPADFAPENDPLEIPPYLRRRCQ